MTRDEQKYYENYFDMFMSDGWKQLEADAKEAKEIIERTTVYNTNTVEELHQAKGQLKVYLYLLRLEESLKDVYESLDSPEETEEDFA